jgi:hypothetical protein
LCGMIRMKIALIYNNDCAHTTAVYFERVIKNAGIGYKHFRTDDAHIPAGFDLYLRIDHGDYKHDIASSLHPAVFYAIDTHLPKPFKKIVRQARHYDIVFCAQKPAVEKLRRQAKTDAQWSALGCDPAVHRKMDVPKKYDIGFVGRNALKFHRGRHLRLLKATYPNSFIAEAPFTRIGEIYSASKIGFNSAIYDDVNMRVFEIMSCGCFLMTNRIKNPGLYELFTDGVHMITYTDDTDMLKKAAYYLAHDDERERRGYERVLAVGTYFHAVQRMFNYIAFKFGGAYNGLRL